MLIILACLAGVLIGLTSNVVVLLPLTLVIALVCAFMTPGQGLGAAGAAVIIPAVSLQAGFMLGLTARDVVAQLRAKLNIAQSKRV